MFRWVCASNSYQIAKNHGSWENKSKVVKSHQKELERTPRGQTNHPDEVFASNSYTKFSGLRGFQSSHKNTEWTRNPTPPKYSLETPLSKPHFNVWQATPFLATYISFFNWSWPYLVFLKYYFLTNFATINWSWPTKSRSSSSAGPLGPLEKLEEVIV